MSQRAQGKDFKRYGARVRTSSEQNLMGVREERTRVTDMQGPSDSYPAALTDCGDTVSFGGKESDDYKIQGWQSRFFEEHEEF